MTTPRRGHVRRALALAAVVALACSAPGARSADAPLATTRQMLVGAWRLVGIDVDGPAGAETDPFYGRGATGVLLYDASGWFSVQIESHPRPSVAVPAARPSRPLSAAATRAKAAALDSYYAYYGTWEFDPLASTVTHHAQGAVYPSEDGATYTQSVRVDGDRMTFTRSQGAPPHRTVQTKRWERLKPEAQ